MILVVRELYVKHSLTSHKIMEILDNNPELEKITCPPSLYERIAPKYIEALSKLGIKVESSSRRGRPKKYGREDRESVHKMFKQGFTPQEISNTLEIPLKTVYYLNDTPLKKGRKVKYTPQTVSKVRSLHENRVSARDISTKLNIPLRTVYSLLNRKQ